MTHSSKQILLKWLDALILGCVLLLIATWIFTDVSLHLGDFVFSLKWTPTHMLWVLFLVVLRMAVARFKAKNGFWEQAIYWKLFMAVVTPFVLLIGFEQVLQALDYDPSFTPIVFQKGDTVSAQDDRILPDRSELLWKLKPNSLYQGKSINSIGVLDREIPPKGKNERRVFCFGDSVTAQGQPPYTVHMQSILSRHSSRTQDWQVYYFGAPGYSSRQGLAFFRRVGKPLKPDIITVWFGWNDHWLFEQTDLQRMAIPMSPRQGRLHNLLLQKRLGKLLLNLAKPSLRIQKTDKDLTFRVPPNEYDEVLSAFIREAREIGAQTVLITAPRRRIHDRIVKTGHALSPESAAEAHDLFNEVMRKTAAREKAPLLDMERLLAGPEYDHFFEADGIHFDDYFKEETEPDSIKEQPGLEFVAQILSDFLLRLDADPDQVYPQP